MDNPLLMPSSRVLPYLDAAMALWVAAWIGLGVAIGINVGQLSDLSHTVTADGSAVQAVGSSLSALASVPIIGGAIGQAAQQVQQAGASAVASGQSSASAIHALSILLAVAVALLPSVPVLGFYLPSRVRRHRETRALERALREHGRDPRFQAFLARRALASLDYRRLDDFPVPWSDVPDVDDGRLAAAELRRLGIDPTALEPRPRG